MLPKVFYIKANHANEHWKNYINWLNKTYKEDFNDDSNGYYGINTDQAASCEDYISSFGKDVPEITLEQWNILLEGFPEKWYIKCDSSTVKVVGNWFNNNHQRGNYANPDYDYFQSNNPYLAYPILSGSTHYSKSVPEGYTELTFEEFQTLTGSAIEGYIVPSDMFGGAVKEGSLVTKRSLHIYHDVTMNFTFPAEIVETWKVVLKSKKEQILIIGSNSTEVIVKEGDNNVHFRSNTESVENITKIISYYLKEFSAGEWILRVNTAVRFIQIGCVSESNLFSLDELIKVRDSHSKIN